MSQITQLIKLRKTKHAHQLNGLVECDEKHSKLLHGKWEIYCVGLPPNVCITLESAINGQCKRVYKAYDCRFVVDGFQDQLSKTHQNHRHFYHLYFISIFELNLLQNKKQIDPSIYCFTSQRALKNRRGTYELVKVITQPYSISKEGCVMDYISWYIPLKAYQGEPFISNIIPIKNSDVEVIDHFNSIFNDQKKEQVHYLNFTERQKEAILLISKQKSKNEIAKHMNVSYRTIEKYNQQILSKGQDHFPLNDFKTALDVVKYFQQMKIL